MKTGDIIHWAVVDKFGLVLLFTRSRKRAREYAHEFGYRIARVVLDK